MVGLCESLHLDRHPIFDQSLSSFPTPTILLALQTQSRQDQVIPGLVTPEPDLISIQLWTSGVNLRDSISFQRGTWTHLRYRGSLSRIFDVLGGLKIRVTILDSRIDLIE